VSFAHPLVLVAAVCAVFIFAWAFKAFERRRTAQALTYSNLAFALEALRPPRWPAALFFTGYVVAVAALSLALATPNFVVRVPSRDGTVILCIDTSGSMRAVDLSPTRAAAARAAARAFIDAVPEGTQIGIVTFSSDASAQLAPTADLDAARDALDRIPPPDGATAIGDALQLAARELPPHGRRAIVLLTDGVNNRGTDPIAASQAIGATGVRIETVGVGSSDSGETIPGTSDPADLDVDALRAIAQNGGGRYVGARDAGALQDAFRRIALDTSWTKKRIDGSLPFAFGGGALLLLTFLAGLATGRVP
jgi:Ca-activated chloride channel family protein